MASINDLAATTELDAVNELLEVIGEEPITDVDAATQADVSVAVQALRAAVRQVCSMGWRFNTERNLAIAPTLDDFVWSDPDGSNVTLSIFKPPAGLLGFTPTIRADQQGSAYLDAVIRVSKQYTEGTPPDDVPVLVFYDRALNRDGWPTADRDFIYIDPTWIFNFEQLPEEARKYVTMLAASRFQRSVQGSQAVEAFTKDDLSLAFRNLKRAHGENDDYNMLQNADVSDVLGGRPRIGGGAVSSLRDHLGLL